MEKGLYLTDAWIPEKNIEGFEYIYYGSEFCINKIFYLSRLEQIIEYCKKYDKTLCFMTPLIPEAYLEDFLSIFYHVCESQVKKEIVINDYGLMQLINEKYKGKYILTYGRLLNRIKKNPNIMNFFNKFNEASKVAIQTSAINNQYAFKILKKFGFCNLQYENVVQANHIPSEYHFNKHLLFPHIQVSTSRKCMGTSINSDTFYLNGLCDHSCEEYTYTLYNKTIKQELKLNGNTIMYVNTDIPKNIEEYSRIVYNNQVLSWDDIVYNIN